MENESKKIKMLSAKEVAAVLGVSYEAALAFIRESGIAYIRIGKQYRVLEAKLAEFLQKPGQIQISLTENILHKKGK